MLSLVVEKSRVKETVDQEPVSPIVVKEVSSSVLEELDPEADDMSESDEVNE